MSLCESLTLVWAKKSKSWSSSRGAAAPLPFSIDLAICCRSWVIFSYRSLSFILSLPATSASDMGSLVSPRAAIWSLRARNSANCRYLTFWMYSSSRCILNYDRSRFRSLTTVRSLAIDNCTFFKSFLPKKIYPSCLVMRKSDLILFFSLSRTYQSLCKSEWFLRRNSSALHARPFLASLRASSFSEVQALRSSLEDYFAYKASSLARPLAVEMVGTPFLK